MRAPEATRSSRKKKSTGAAARLEAIDATISLPAALLLSDRVTGSERRCYKWTGVWWLAVCAVPNGTAVGVYIGGIQNAGRPSPLTIQARLISCP